MKLDLIFQRYKEIEEQIENLKKEKEFLRKEVKTYMEENKIVTQVVATEDLRYRISTQLNTKINYNEPLLRKRLGKNYKFILEPDLQKIRKNLPRLKTILGDALEEFSSPSRILIKNSIEKNIFSKEDFKGAFEKAENNILYAMNLNKKK